MDKFWSLKLKTYRVELSRITVIKHLWLERPIYIVNEIVNASLTSQIF